jgi:hypothetical protein
VVALTYRVAVDVPARFNNSKATGDRAGLPPKRLGDEEPRAVGDPMHVETSFVRNLGGLIRVRLGMPDRLMKAEAER